MVFVIKSINKEEEVEEEVEKESQIGHNDLL